MYKHVSFDLWERAEDMADMELESGSAQSKSTSTPQERRGSVVMVHAIEACLSITLERKLHYLNISGEAPSTGRIPFLSALF